EAIDVAKVARFANPQDHRLHESIEATEQMGGRYLDEVPGADGMFDRLKHCVLADALFAAEHQGVIDLVFGALHAMSEPRNNMGALGAEHVIDVIEPHRGLSRMAVLDERRTVEIEAAHAVALDPSAMRKQKILDEHR